MQLFNVDSMYALIQCMHLYLGSSPPLWSIKLERERERHAYLIQCSHY